MLKWNEELLKELEITREVDSTIFIFKFITIQSKPSIN